MPKRNAEEKIQHYKRKIQRLEKKTTRRIRRISSSDSDENPSPEAMRSPPTMTAVSDSEPDITIEESTGVGNIQVSPDQLTSSNVGPTSPVATDLDPNILTALGEITDEVPEFGEKIHENLAKIWIPLLKKGMSKENKEILLKKYLIPENCTLLLAPTLNPEISAAITESGRFRDKKMSSNQQQLGVGITAVNKGLNLLINNQNNVEAIKFITDGCRILTDLHHENTEARIKFIIPGLDKSFLQFLERTERDSTLFGKDLSEKIKASKAIVKQGEQIKKSLPASKPTTSGSKAHPTAYRSSYQGNWSGPSRSQSNRGGARGGHKRPSHRAPPASSHSKTNHKLRASTRRR